MVKNCIHQPSLPTHSSSHPVGLSRLQLSTHSRRFNPKQKDDLLCISPPANCKQIEVLSDGFKALIAGSTSSPTKSSVNLPIGASSAFAPIFLLAFSSLGVTFD